MSLSLNRVTIYLMSSTRHATPQRIGVQYNAYEHRRRKWLLIRLKSDVHQLKYVRYHFALRQSTPSFSSILLHSSTAAFQSSFASSGIVKRLEYLLLSGYQLCVSTLLSIPAMTNSESRFSLASMFFLDWLARPRRF